MQAHARARLPRPGIGRRPPRIIRRGRRRGVAAPGGTPARAARPASERHSLRRRRGRAAALRDPAAARPGARRRLEDHPWRRALLRRHEDDPQRPPGRRSPAHRRRARGIPGPIRAQRGGARRRLRLHLRPRPPAAALRSYHGADDARWIWRCHIDTSEPNPAGLGSSCAPFLADYDAAVFTMAEFVPPDLPVGRVEIIPPAIDPLSPKNIALDATLSAPRAAVDRASTSTARWSPRSSRFDPWKDPLGVIAGYRLARREVPGAPARAGGLDGPRRSGGLGDLPPDRSAARASDPDIHLFTNLDGRRQHRGQRLSAPLRGGLQKSLREGFGLVVSEALWKGTPVVAGRAGGIPLQIGPRPAGSSSRRSRNARNARCGCSSIRWRARSWQRAAANGCASGSCSRG